MEKDLSLKFLSNEEFFDEFVGLWNSVDKPELKESNPTLNELLSSSTLAQKSIEEANLRCLIGGIKEKSIIDLLAVLTAPGGQATDKSLSKFNDNQNKRAKIPISSAQIAPLHIGSETVPHDRFSSASIDSESSTVPVVLGQPLNNRSHSYSTTLNGMNPSCTTTESILIDKSKHANELTSIKSSTISSSDRSYPNPNPHPSIPIVPDTPSVLRGGTYGQMSLDDIMSCIDSHSPFTPTPMSQKSHFFPSTPSASSTNASASQDAGVSCLITPFISNTSSFNSTKSTLPIGINIPQHQLPLLHSDPVHLFGNNTTKLLPPPPPIASSIWTKMPPPLPLYSDYRSDEQNEQQRVVNNGLLHSTTDTTFASVVIPVDITTNGINIAMECCDVVPNAPASLSPSSFTNVMVDVSAAQSSYIGSLVPVSNELDCSPSVTNTQQLPLPHLTTTSTTGQSQAQPSPWYESDVYTLPETGDVPYPTPFPSIPPLGYIHRNDESVPLGPGLPLLASINTLPAPIKSCDLTSILPDIRQKKQMEVSGILLPAKQQQKSRSLMDTLMDYFANDVRLTGSEPDMKRTVLPVDRVIAMTDLVLGFIPGSIMTSRRSQAMEDLFCAITEANVTPNIADNTLYADTKQPILTSSEMSSNTGNEIESNMGQVLLNNLFVNNIENISSNNTLLPTQIANPATYVPTNPHKRNREMDPEDYFENSSNGSTDEPPKQLSYVKSYAHNFPSQTTSFPLSGNQRLHKQLKISDLQTNSSTVPRSNKRSEVSLSALTSKIITLLNSMSEGAGVEQEPPFKILSKSQSAALHLTSTNGTLSKIPEPDRVRYIFCGREELFRHTESKIQCGRRRLTTVFNILEVLGMAVHPHKWEDFQWFGCEGINTSLGSLREQWLSQNNGNVDACHTVPLSVHGSKVREQDVCRRVLLLYLCGDNDLSVKQICEFLGLPPNDASKCRRVYDVLHVLTTTDVLCKFKTVRSCEKTTVYRYGGPLITKR